MHQILINVNSYHFHIDFINDNYYHFVSKLLIHVTYII